MKFEFNLWHLRAITLAIAVAGIVWGSLAAALACLTPVAALLAVEVICRTR